MKLRGAWRRDYSEFFDTQEALLIDAMDNADSTPSSPACNRLR